LYADDNTPCLHHKQASASSPNVVHSFDASHKYETCYRLRQKNADFRHRHDCFGTHAADGDLLHETLRSAFIDMCSENLLENLRTQWSAMYPHAKLESPPELGDFDIQNVANAPYFFH
jgi:DNA-directed RNA polymerase